MSTPIKHFVLRFTNKHGEFFYYVSAGDVHGGITLIAATTPDIKKARQFETVPLAATVLKQAGDPEGWEILPIS